MAVTIDGTTGIDKVQAGAVDIGDLVATGTADATTFLRGDGTWGAPAGGVTSLNGETGAITNTSLYAIGSYTSGRPANATDYATDSTVAGSSLYAIATSSFWWTSGARFVTTPGSSNTAPSSLVNTGTWRCMSYAGSAGGGGLSAVWVRIS